MDRPASTTVVVSAALGLLLQLGGFGWAIGPGQPEVSLAVGLVLAAVGTPGTMYAIERYAVAIGRSDRWALLGILGPVGLLVAVALRPRAVAVPQEGVGSQPRAPGAVRRSRADRVAGALVGALVAAGLGWTAFRLSTASEAAAPPDAASMRQNELRAFERLGVIAAAQQRYAERDWDGDGRKTYAAFAVHLWQSVDAQGTPVPVELIGRELGFAMVPEFALDGYVFHSLHWQSAGSADRSRGRPSDDSLVPIDHEKGWAVLAHPVEPHKTGLLSFLADESGSIWVVEHGEALKARPGNPAAEGWTPIRSAPDLVARQQSVVYEVARPTGR